MYKYSLLIAFLFLAIASQAQDSNSTELNKPTWGIGLKSNNGITLKKYQGNKGFELIICRPSPWKRHYDDSHNFFKDKGYTYAGYDNISRPLAIQVRYLIHKDISGLRGFQWYYGAGAQLVASSYYYHYYYQNGSSIVYEKERVNEINAGLDGIAGVEYTFKNFPLSAFYDVNLYVEGFRHPLRMRMQSGIGLRYNF